MFSFFAKKSGVLSFGIVLAIGAGLTAISQNLQPDVIKAISPSSLYKSYYFSDGGTSPNKNYAKRNIATTVSYASDNPGTTKSSGGTPWEADYANLSLTYGTFLGGKATSTAQTNDTTAWANIKTKFRLDRSIDVVVIRDCEYFGVKSKLTSLYLQSSADSHTWTTVRTLSIPSNLWIANLTVGDGINMFFDGFTISANSYIRFGVGIQSSVINSGLEFNGMAFHSYTLCG